MNAFLVCEGGRFRNRNPQPDPTCWWSWPPRMCHQDEGSWTWQSSQPWRWISIILGLGTRILTNNSKRKYPYNPLPSFRPFQNKFYANITQLKQPSFHQFQMEFICWITLLGIDHISQKDDFQVLIF